MVAATRRRLLAVAGLGATALGAGALAGCGGSSGAPGPPAETVTTERSEVVDSDVAILDATLDVEQRAVAGYELLTPALDGAERATTERILAQERDHVAALRAAIAQRGAAPKLPNPRYTLGRVGDRRRALELAARLEDASIAACLDAIRRVSSPDLRTTLASILTVEAEQLSEVRRGLGRSPLGLSVT